MNSSNSTKKTLSIASVAMMLGFAIALANANESEQQAGQMAGQEAGTMSGSTDPATTDTTTTDDMSGSMGESPTTPPTTTQDSSALSEFDSMRSCTDRNGVTFRKGESGFGECISWMKENRKGDMSGQVGTTDSTTTTPSLPSTP